MKVRRINNKKLIFFKRRTTLSFFLAIVIITLFITASSVNSLYIVNKKIINEIDETDGCKCGLSDGNTPLKQKQDNYGTGFIPPEMDLSHLTGQVMPEKYISLTPPSSFDWRSSGKVTSVKNQSACNACYAFASIACFESKVIIQGGGTVDLSEDNVKECEWYHSCCNPSNFYKVASFLSQKGTVLESCDPYQPNHNTDPACGSCAFQQTILDWRVIAGNSVPSTNFLKNYIYNKGPIYVAIWSGAVPYDATWRNEFVNYNGTYTMYKPWTGDTDHAVLIVGWDDSLNHAGGTGGWICKNSWGTGWGGTCGYGTEKGYFTIAYGSAAIGKYSSFVDQWGKYDTNGGIAYYDEGGWSDSWGYSSNTAWGLCKYGFSISTMVSRVEFWTNDKTTDVDVYIYDDFDGTTLSNLLWSSLDNSFDEAGYHGVAVVPPLSVMGMNSIYVVVKFTDSISQYPVVVDVNGPTVTGYTYTSSSGSSGSWSDRGMGSPKCDVAIRLRYSGGNPPNKPTITGETQGKAKKSYGYDFVSTDTDGDKLSYYIKWGDGTQTDWTPLQNSGVKYTGSHSWGSSGTYTVEAKTKDIYGLESNWSNLEVKMPRNKDVSNSMFLKFFERFILGFSLIKIFIGK
jgi:C1A family cysteine protease